MKNKVLVALIIACSYIGYSYDDYYASCISDDGAMTIWNVDSVIGMRPAITLKIA